mgnify:CR=1 FL=1
MKLKDIIYNDYFRLFVKREGKVVLGKHYSNLWLLCSVLFATFLALSSKYVEDGDFIRIGQIGIGWTIPNRIKWLSEITVQASARNLLTLSKYSGWNPDVNSFGINALSSGLDYGSYPIQRTIVMGVSVKF